MLLKKFRLLYMNSFALPRVNCPGVNCRGVNCRVTEDKRYKRVQKVGSREANRGQKSGASVIVCDQWPCRNYCTIYLLKSYVEKILCGKIPMWKKSYVEKT